MLHYCKKIKMKIYIWNTFMKPFSIIWPTLTKSLSEGILEGLYNLCFPNNKLKIVFQNLTSAAVPRLGTDFQRT